MDERREGNQKMQNSVDQLFRAIYGHNGDKGVLTRLSLLEERMDEIAPMVKQMYRIVVERGVFYEIIRAIIPPIITSLLIYLMLGGK